MTIIIFSFFLCDMMSKYLIQIWKTWKTSYATVVMKSCVTLHLSTATPTPGKRTGNKRPCSSFEQTHTLGLFFTGVHRRFATKTHTKRPCLSGRVIKCWVTTSTHHVLTYFSNLPFVFLCCLSHSCEGQTSLALHDSWHSLHPRLWDFLYMEWIWVFLTSVTAVSR